MTRTILCFGDSNTHGTPPMSDVTHHPRLGPGLRWPTVMAADLGEDWTLIEEGLPGRTTCFADDMGGAHMDGRTGLRIALASHGPVDVLTIMLGTNDLHLRYGATSERIAAGLAALLDIAKDPDIQARHGGFRTLVICPPPVVETGPFVPEFFGGNAKALALPSLYADLAEAYGAGFLDAGTVIEVSAVDGVHFGEAMHAKLGGAVAQAVMAMPV